MTGRIAQRLAHLGITLPAPGAPGGSYVPFVVVGDIVYLSGQVAHVDGRLQHAGKVGRDLTIEQGRAAARICALNLLAQLEIACDGDLDRVARCVRLNGFVNCTPEFLEPPKVIDGASSLIVEIFGERGQHARTSVGVASLPRGSATEVEAIFLRSR